MRTSQILKQLGVLDVAADISARDPKNAVEPVLEPTEAAVQPAEEDEELAEMVEHPPTVAVLSKEQAMKLLKPGRGQGSRTRRKGQTTSEESLEGKFVDLIDLLPPVPAKGEFDVNKIKSSLYFFS